MTKYDTFQMQKINNDVFSGCGSVRFSRKKINWLRRNSWREGVSILSWLLIVLSSFDSLPRGIYPPRISWNDPTTLAIASAKTIKIMMITTEQPGDHQSSVPKKHMNTG